ncbi:hypothetical protein BG004_007742 [Podila humilis]|nr:hypothetical protein BG004_007742 [Podila humilis]
MNATSLYTIMIARPHYNTNLDSCSGFEEINRLVSGNPSSMALAKNRLLRAEKLYQKQLGQRDVFLEAHGYGKPGFSPWARSDGQQPWWWYFQPAFNCPHEIQRVGRYNDGGKWMCGVSVLERPSTKKCVVYSLGVFDDSSFEAEMMDRTNCEVWAFDASVDKVNGDAFGNPKIHFNKVFIGAEDKVDNEGHVWKTLSTVMKENGHTWIDVLKVDIEGSEFKMMDALMDAYKDQPLPFSQLQVEIHLFDKGMGTDVTAFGRFKKWFERLEAHHLRPFWSEFNIIPNQFYDIPIGYAEYSFINLAGDHSLLQD